MMELIIIALLVFIGVREYLHSKERKNFINAIIAKNSQDLRDLNMVEKTKIKIDPKQNQPDIIPLDQASDEELAKALKNEGL